MQKRAFGKLGFQTSLFGFGAMRFKTLDGDHSRIDESVAVPLVRAALDGGVSYIDTAYVYHGGFSERLLAKALSGGYRERVKIATKLPGWGEGGAADWEAKLDESLKRLDTDCVDFYLLHGLNWAGFNARKDELVAFLENMVRKGKILYPSFSFHDDYEAFKRILDYYPHWCMAQVQFNFMDIENQASLEGVKYAGEKGVPIVVMEPLHGGVLGGNVPDAVKALYDAFPVKRSPAEWAFRFVYDRPEVAVILSGINTFEQLNENLRIFEHAPARCLSAEERKLFDDVRAAYHSLKQTGCTGCRYCMPCPEGVYIPELFSLYDTGCMFNTFEGSFRWRTGGLKRDGHGPDKCVECGQCEAKCPQGIKIIEKLKAVASV